MVERFLAKEGVRVRFPLPAPKKNSHPCGGNFSFVFDKGIERGTSEIPVTCSYIVYFLKKASLGERPEARLAGQKPANRPIKDEETRTKVINQIGV